MRRALGLSVLLVLAFAACKSSTDAPVPLTDPPNGTRKVRVVFPEGEPEVVGSTPPKAPPRPVPASSASAKRGELRWTTPETWRSVDPSSPMRTAQYVVPRAADDTDDAELAVFYFGSTSAGTVDETFKRWVGAFDVDAGAARRSSRVVSNWTVSLIEVEGSFDPSNAMFGATGKGSARPNFAMLGAIVEASDGPYYFKLVGPAATVRSAKSGFDKMISSFGATVAPSASGSSRPASSASSRPTR